MSRYQVDNRHYTIPELNGRKLPRVTKILDLLAKYALYFWHSKVTIEYFVETYLSKAIAGEISLDEISENIEEIVKESKNQPKKVKEEAGDLGSRTHHKVQEFIIGVIFEGKELVLEMDEDLKKPMAAFFEWWNDNHVIPIATERTVWSLRGGGYAGTLDHLWYVGSPLFVVDIKTGKRVFDDQPMQLASYFFAAIERPVLKGLIPEEAAILRLDKETGMPEFHHIPRPQLILEQEKFIRLVEFWHINQKVKEIKKSIKKGEKNGRLRSNKSDKK